MHCLLVAAARFFLHDQDAVHFASENSLGIVTTIVHNSHTLHYPESVFLFTYLLEISPIIITTGFAKFGCRAHGQQISTILRTWAVMCMSNFISSIGTQILKGSECSTARPLLTYSYQSLYQLPEKYLL